MSNTYYRMIIPGTLSMKEIVDGFSDIFSALNSSEEFYNVYASTSFNSRDTSDYITGENTDHLISSGKVTIDIDYDSFYSGESTERVELYVTSFLTKNSPDSEPVRFMEAPYTTIIMRTYTKKVINGFVQFLKLYGGVFIDRNSDQHFYNITERLNIVAQVNKKETSLISELDKLLYVYIGRKVQDNHNLKKAYDVMMSIVKHEMENQCHNSLTKFEDKLKTL